MEEDISEEVKKALRVANLSKIAIVIMFTLTVLINLGWFFYRFEGEQYYLKIDHPSGSYPVTLPVKVNANGYVYRGKAVTNSGKTKYITLRTTADNPGPFTKGQVVRVTVNQHYGVTNYRLVRNGMMPKVKD